MNLSGPSRNRESLPVVSLPGEAARHPSVNSHLLAAPVRIVAIVGFWVLVVLARALALDAEDEMIAREASKTIVGIWETRDGCDWFEFTAEGQFSVSRPPNPFRDKEPRDAAVFRGRYSILPRDEVEISDLWHPQSGRQVLKEQGCRFKAELSSTGSTVRITGPIERRATLVVPPLGFNRVCSEVELPPKGKEMLYLYRVR